MPRAARCSSFQTRKVSGGHCSPTSTRWTRRVTGTARGAGGYPPGGRVPARHRWEVAVVARQLAWGRFGPPPAGQGVVQRLELEGAADHIGGPGGADQRLEPARQDDVVGVAEREQVASRFRRSSVLRVGEALALRRVNDPEARKPFREAERDVDAPVRAAVV